MKVGLVTPVLLLNPRMHNAWEVDAGIDAIRSIAETADALGYHHLTASNHIAIPPEVTDRRGSRYWDAAVTLGYLAAVTHQIKLATYCLVLGYHHPLEIVKRFGTLDAASNGRLILGLGVGSLEQEFRLLDKPFEGRGDRADDAIRAIQASLGKRQPEYHGTHYDFDGFIVDPNAVQQHVPIWIGGRTARSLRRAVELEADAWAPFGVEPEQVPTMMAKVGADRAPALALAVEPPLDPIGDPDTTRRELDRYRSAGADYLNLRLRHDSLAHCLEQLEAFSLLAPSGAG